MELKDVLQHLGKAAEFVEWRKGHAESYLAHAFVLLDEANKDAWHIGYFTPETDRMTTFIVSLRHIEVVPDQEILRSEQAILELNPADVTLGHEAALKKAEEYHHLHHPREIPLKKFFILQSLDGKAVYNITFFFQSMKTLNLKLSAADGHAVSHSFQTLMEFDRKA